MYSTLDLPMRKRRRWMRIGLPDRQESSRGKELDPLANLLARRLGVDRHRSRRILQRFVRSLKDRLIADGRLEVRGLGKWEIRRKKIWPRLRARARKIIEPGVAVNVVYFWPVRRWQWTEEEINRNRQMKTELGKEMEAALRLSARYWNRRFCTVCGRRIRGKGKCTKIKLSRWCRICALAAGRHWRQPVDDRAAIGSNHGLKPMQRRHRWRLLQQEAREKKSRKREVVYEN